MPLESITLTLSYDPSKLPEEVDPTTSEGKAAIKAAIIQSMTDAYDASLTLDFKMEQPCLSIVEAFTES